MIIYVYNVKKQLVENAWELRNPAQIKRVEGGSAVQEVYWGSTWHMQTPLENLETGSYLVIEFHPDSSIHSNPASRANTFATTAVYPINTEVINSGIQVLQLTVPADDGKSKQMNPIMLNSEKCSLQAELVINTRDRAMDPSMLFT